MHNAVKSYTGHDVDEETDNLVHGMENERVPPHDNGNGVVPESKAVGTDEHALGAREDPETEHQQSVDKVAEIGEEVVVALFVVGIVAQGHEVEQLDRVPQREPLRACADQVSGNEDVHDGGDERGLFSGRDGGIGSPLLVEALDGLAHALLVLVQLLTLIGNATAPLLDSTISGGGCSRLGSVSQAFGLGRDGSLELLDALRQGQVLDEIEHGQAFDGREEGGFLGVRVVHVGGAVGEGV